MNRKSSSSKPTGDKMKNAEKTLESLLEEIYYIEQLLEPFGSPEATALRAETNENKKKLESLDDSEASVFRLFSLKKDMDRIKDKAESLAKNSAKNTRTFLTKEIEYLEKKLEVLESAEATPLKAETKNVKDKLSSSNESELSALQNDIGKLTTQSFLLKEIEDLEKKLEPLAGVEATTLKSEIAGIKGRLISIEGDELFYLRKETGKIKERAMQLATKQTWWDKFQKWRSTLPVTAWLAVIPALVALYIITMITWQWVEQPVIQTFQVETATAQTATVAVVQTETVAVMQTASAVSIANVSIAMASATETPTPVPTATK